MLDIQGVQTYMRQMKQKHEIADLQRRFRYDPEAGTLHKLGGSGTRPRAGWKNRFGYRRVRVDDVEYPEHVLIFAIVEGRWPRDQIDHINCISDDNRWVNLREATASQNKANSHYRRKHKGLKGAYKNATGRWQAMISAGGGKLKYLGLFDTEQEAHEAYAKAAKEKFGEFARTWPACLD